MGEDLSVVIPVWDSYVEYLPAAVGSVPTDTSVLVIDNASTAALPELPPNASVLHLAARVTVGAARNAALAQVETPFVAFLDADDSFLPGALDVLRVPVGAIGIAGRRLAWNPVTGSEATATRMPRPGIIRLSRHRRTFALMNIMLNTFPIGTGVFRTEAVRRAGGFGDGNLGEDWVLGAALAQLGQIVLLDEPTVRHRVEAGSLWQRAHSREALLDRCRQVRRNIAQNPEQPAGSRVVARAAAPFHYALVSLQVRGKTFSPTPDLPRG